MQRTATTWATRALAATLLVGAMGGPAWAEKPEWAGKGHGNKNEKREKHEDRGERGEHGGKRERREARVGAYFDEHDRHAARAYYDERYRGGRGCPPGLAKKHNGCLPPGQAKKYVVGQPLPAGMVLYPVPQPVIVQLPPAPAGYKYVRVAADILLIAVGTSMVVDAMTDLLQM